MGIDDIAVALMFEMGRKMSEARGNHPKYIVKEQPQVGKHLEVFEYMPRDGDVREGEYVATGSFTPKDITRESDESTWYLVNDGASQFVVHQNSSN